MDYSYLKSLAISNDGFVFDPCTGHSFTTNATGLYLLKQMQQGTESRTLADVLRRDLGAPPETASEDVERFLGALQEFGWIKANATESRRA